MRRLSTDYTTANYTGVYQKYSDGLNPVIFDTDGSITDALFGAGAKSSILGFAGSAYYTSGPSAGKYAEGQAVINGYINISDATLTEVLAHEIGHFFGLDHSQLDNTQGLASSNYVLMYPIAYRTLTTLHEDDIAAVTSLYPAANVELDVWSADRHVHDRRRQHRFSARTSGPGKPRPARCTASFPTF